MIIILGGYIYVEFFFMITGYFTILHFDKESNFNMVTLDDKVKASLRYTIHKFKGYMPYVIIAVFFAAIVENRNILTTGVNNILNAMIDIPFELLLLSGCLWMKDYVPTLWFLSAMFLVFPIFSSMCQMKNRNILFLLSAYVPLIYYEMFSKIETDCDFNLVRALTYLLLGVFVYRLSRYLKCIDVSKIYRILLTIIEQSCFLFTLLALYCNCNMEKNILLSFVIGLTILFSGKSYSYRVNGRVISYLGKISLVIYLFHWEIGSIIGYSCSTLDTNTRIFLYYIVTILASVIIYAIVEKIKTICHFNIELGA